MEIKSIRNKGDSIRVIGEITSLYKYDGLNITEETIPSFDGIGYVLNYNEDVYLFIEQRPYFDVIRIGEPPKMMILKDTQSRTFNQYDQGGSLLDSIVSEEIGFGYYRVKPTTLGKGYFELDGLKQPYDFSYIVEVIDPGTTGSGISADQLFLDTGLTTYGFIGDKNSYFDLLTGEWVQDINSIAKAEDLAKAITFKYGLEWNDRTAPNHIYNYVKYFRTYNEELKRFLLYAPSITPGSDINNFDLITEDELGNTYVKGVSMLLVQDLETILEGSSGVIVPFK